MADYPSFVQIVGSKPTRKTGLRIDRAVSGKARGQCFYTADVKTFIIKHILNSTERDSLLDHYEANKTETFTFTWAGDETAYTVIYGEDTLDIVPRGGGYYNVTVVLEEVG